MHHRYLSLLVLGIAAVLLTAGCVKLGESSELPLSAVEPTPVPYDRISCDEIYGTAFRSANERAWFEENCSKWPVVKVGDEPVPSGSAQQSGEPPECAAMRGRPYESNAQRTFYLQNCNQSTQNNQQQQQSQQQQPDRTNCDEIRGTPYRSANERNWFTRNCSPQQQQQQQQMLPNPGPDRTNCDEIRGGGYRSPGERQWFLQNCR